MNHWTEEFYRLVDANDPGLTKLMASDIRSQVGNHPVTIGVAAIFEGPIGRSVAVIRGATHAFRNIWDVNEDTAILESEVTYHRLDGRDVRVPAITVVHRNASLLIDEIRLYIDTAPLWDGLPASFKSS